MPAVTLSVYLYVAAAIGLTACLVLLVRLNSRLKGLRREAMRARDEFSDIMDALPAMVFFKDGENRLLHVNSAYAQAMGMTRQQLAGVSCFDVFPGEAQAYWDDDLAVINSGKPKRGIEEQMDSAHGRIWVRTDKIPYRNESGEVTGVVGFAIDITDQKLAQEQEAAQHARNEALVSALGEVVYERSVSSDTILWRGAVAEVLGCAPEDLGRTSAQWLERIHPDDRKRARAHVAGAIPEQQRFNMEYRLRHRDGHYVWVNDRGLARAGGATGGVSVVGVIEDIGYRKNYEEIITRFNEELARSNKVLQQFAYVASHDLQEPLRKIVSFGDLLLESLGESPSHEAMQYARRMQTAAHRMRDFIRDLLRYSRVNTRPRPPTRVDLAELVAQVVSGLDEPIRATRAVMDVGDLHAVSADPDQARELFEQLLSNALKFVSQKRTPHIQVRSRRVGNRLLEVTVKDNGIGFEQRHAERMFAPFQRLHTREAFAGTGMGLAICKRIVERHGGKLVARSEPDAGATFLFDLPLADSN